MNNTFEMMQSSSNTKIIIGENGTGKSALLNDLSKEHLNEGKTVIAIATSIHDKFTARQKKFHFYGGRQGRNVVEKAIKKSLLGNKDDNVDRIKYLITALEYAMYSPEIGIKVEGFRPENIVQLHESIKDIDEGYDVLNLIKKYEDPFSREMVVSISLWAVTEGNNNISGTALSAFIRYESILKKHKVIKKFSTYLYRENAEIPLTGASSGELMIISMLVHISSYIDKNSVILIDEPENSLHPRWQRKYIDMILDLFYPFQPSVYIATHSPQILPINSESCEIYTPVDGKIIKVDRTTSNNEELLSDVFGVVTPENRFLSDKMIETINDFDSKRIGLDEALLIVEKYENRIYDPRQKEFITGIREIIQSIEEKRFV